MRDERSENRDRSLKCIAWLMHDARPDWEFNGCLAILRRIDQERSIQQIARAALWFATARTNQRTPAMLAEDGAHWHLDDDQDVRLPPKPRCLTEPMGEPLPAERIRAIREQARQGDRA